MAAFCACCGAEITLKAEACPVCGTPQHGMLQPGLVPALDVGVDSSEDDAETGRKLGRSLSCKR
jgi:RNA polymerase subunit RPABC4/transcription elongation factor Spt4